MPASVKRLRKAPTLAVPRKATGSSAGRERVFVVLLRGINVGGRKRVPMQELGALAGGVGCSSVVSYIQSGNLVLLSRTSASALESALERAIAEHFGFQVEVIARRAEDWLVYAEGTPFPALEAERPHLLLLGLAKRPLARGAKAAIAARAMAGEQVEVVGDAIWIDYVGGSARSKVTPLVLDRAAGSTVTTRNWRTVLKLAEMVRSFAVVSPPGPAG